MRAPMKKKHVSSLLAVSVATSTVIALGGAFLSASPTFADVTKWTTINTPSWEDGVILPASDILDYDLGASDGSIIYVVARVDRSCERESSFLSDDVDPGFGYGVFKSSDGGITWKDITQNVLDTDNLPDFDGSGSADYADILSLNFVAVAPDDPDWVAITGYANYGAGPSATEPEVFTIASKNGGDDFACTGDMEDTRHGTMMDIAYSTEVSLELDGIHVIVVMGAYDADNDGVATVAGLDQGAVFCMDAGTWLSEKWEDASYYDGWDGDPAGNANGFPNSGISTYAVIDGRFSPNYADDGTLVVIGIVPVSSGHGTPYVQSGDLLSKQWGKVASLPDPIKITNTDNEIWLEPGIWEAGIALPGDYDGTHSEARVVFGYADAYTEATDLVRPVVFRLDNGEEITLCGPTGNPLASIDIYGDADDGKMMIGAYAEWDDTIGDFGGMLSADPCLGVAVWHTTDLDTCTCCPLWNACCKSPSGTYVARVRYTPDGEKQCATTTGSDGGYAYDGFVLPGPGECPEEVWGTPGDETAFSVSYDDALSFNQIGLVDTNIAVLSDFVVCPDCSVAYLATVNNGEPPGSDCPGGLECPLDCWSFGCDSVWRTFDSGDTWERVFHGDWSDDDDVNPQTLLLRLPGAETEDCCSYDDPYFPMGTVYLGVQGSKKLFYSRDCGQCWIEDPETRLTVTIQDFAVDTEETVYALDEEGNVAKSTNFGRHWEDAMDTGAGSGHMITVDSAAGLVVVGPENGSGSDQVAWSDDEGDTWNTTDEIPSAGEVHVACATTCENIIYIALGGEGGAIYRGDLSDGSWTDMDGARGVDYTGIAVGKSDGTLYASTDDIGVDDNEEDENDFGDWTPCLRSFGSDGDYSLSAVARNLDPCTTECCGSEEWDYLICGLSPQDGPCSGEYFSTQTNALDICGCLTAATNTILYAIDSQEYDVRDGSDGTIWTYEDCASKTGTTLVSPADGSVLDCMGCEGCGAQPFTLKWNRMCNSCSYDIEIMDEDGNVVISIVDDKLTGTTPTLYLNENGDEDYTKELVCGSTYTWHVREANTNCECIHSPWSATWTFTVATSSLNGVSLISPKMAASDVGTANIGFSWTSVPEATSYSLVVSPNANLSGALVSQEISTTAFNFAGPLENEKTYHWQVKAWKDTTLLSTSSVGVFTIKAAPVAATPPVTVTETAAPQVNIPPTQQVTPTWIYIALGVAVALVIVVAILVTRTRRR